MRETPNFAGWHAAVLHREDSNTERLIRQLKLLGMRTSVRWEPLNERELPDMVIVDADQGWDELLPWNEEHPPLPVIALLGSEAPGRIAWALGQGAGAIIAKPIASSAVYPAMVMAVAISARPRTQVTTSAVPPMSIPTCASAPRVTIVAGTLPPARRRPPVAPPARGRWPRRESSTSLSAFAVRHG